MNKCKLHTQFFLFTNFTSSPIPNTKIYKIYPSKNTTKAKIKVLRAKTYIIAYSYSTRIARFPLFSRYSSETEKRHDFTIFCLLHRSTQGDF